MTSIQLHYNGMAKQKYQQLLGLGYLMLPLYLTSKYCNYNGMAK